MQELKEIFIIAVIQSGYDFAGWYGIIHENDSALKWKRYLFRGIKETLDFGVTLYILIWVLQLHYAVIAAFYVAKWFHLCDSLYNIYRYILTNKPTSEWGYWRWWTPLGLLRTNWWGVCVIKGWTELDYECNRGYWGDGTSLLDEDVMFQRPFWRGMVSIREAWLQTGIGLVLAVLLVLIFV